MQTAGQLATSLAQSSMSARQTSSTSTTTTRWQDLDNQQRNHHRDSTNYFFARLETIFGKGRFAVQYPDETAVNAAKREWIMDIGKYDRDQLDHKLALCKSLMGESTTWPDPGKILALTTAGSGGASGQAAMSYRPASEVLQELPEQTEDTRACGRSNLDAMIASLKIDDRSCAKAAQQQRDASRKMLKRFDQQFGTCMIAVDASNNTRRTDVEVRLETGLGGTE